MTLTELLECNRGRTCVLTRRFLGNKERCQPACSRKDERHEFVIGIFEPVKNSAGWNIKTGKGVFCYDNDPQTQSLTSGEIRVNTGSGNVFLDYYSITIP